MGNENKKGVSYLHRTAQPSTFACFRTWRVEGSWSYKTYPGAKVYILFEGTMNLFGIEVWRSSFEVGEAKIGSGESLIRCGKAFILSDELFIRSGKALICSD